MTLSTSCWFMWLYFVIINPAAAKWTKVLCLSILQRWCWAYCMNDSVITRWNGFMWGHNAAIRWFSSIKGAAMNPCFSWVHSHISVCVCVCTDLRSMPPSREALRHSGGDSLLFTSAMVTLYLEVELSSDSRPGTEQNKSVGFTTHVPPAHKHNTTC